MGRLAHYMASAGQLARVESDLSVATVADKIAAAKGLPPYDFSPEANELNQNLQLAAKIARINPTMATKAIGAALARIARIGAIVRRHDENACNREVTPAEEEGAARCMGQIVKIAASLGCEVKHNPDPRGYTIRLLAPGLPGNTWGGDSEGWGIV